MKLIPVRFLLKSFGDYDESIKTFKEQIVQDFSLNQEQNRAFSIIANHAVSSTPEPLHMYLGGMARTGKSQVIKAVTTFFTLIDEQSRIVLLAPTGTAACLIGGSTYHSFLCLSDADNVSLKRLSLLRAKLETVDYIFIDEVSMIGMREIYRISAQLARIGNRTDHAYGGFNMIFAGDFAQLPPPTKMSPLYGLISNKHSGSYINQQSIIGKALWHQTTVVVILRVNMQQRGISKADHCLQLVLSNMRYKGCTTADLAHLKSLRVSIGSTIFTNPMKRNISAITALNSQRDKLNKTGCDWFAFDSNQELDFFFL